MKQTIAFLGVLLLLVLTMAAAAPAQKAEVFGGYQLTRVSPGHGISNFNLNGWDASLSGYFHRYIGVTADFSGTYGTPFTVSTHLYTYMFGPVLRATNSSPIVPFAHVLFGGAHISGSASGVGSASDSGFAWAPGAGVDVKMGKIASVRLAQFDFLQTHISSETQNNFRYSAGLVLRF